jgi:fatty-acyl-CoA synthase
VAAPDSDPGEEAILEFVADRVAGYKELSGVELRDDLPETATGKVQKYALREEYWGDEDRMVGTQ